MYKFIINKFYFVKIINFGTKNRERKLKDKSQSGRKYLSMYVTDKVSNEIPYTVTSKTTMSKN